MADQTKATLAGGGATLPDLKFTHNDAQLLRALAGRVAELAARPGEAVKRRLWQAHNDLQPTRPLIFCDPENGWNEIIPQDQLHCTGELARGWEMRLRKEIFWGERMGDDRVVEPCFDVRHIHQDSGWGLKETKIGGDHGGAYTWEAPLTSYDDFHKLHFPVITIDQESTQRMVELARATFGDLLKVRLKTNWWWTLGMTWTAANLRGLEQIMLDVYDHPDELKRLMAFLRDGTLAKIDFLQSNGLLGSNANDAYVGSGGFGYTSQLKPGDSAAPASTADMWGFCESQETTAISPEMFGEFVYPYQRPLLERFGLNCYGCCEPLDLRWNVVKNTPRLRRVSVSPWANVEAMALNLQDRFVFSYKPAPTDLSTGVLHEDRIRAGLRRVIETTRGCHLEIIMKDNHTLGNQPENVVRWCRIAQEEADRAK